MGSRKGRSRRETGRTNGDPERWRSSRETGMTRVRPHFRFGSKILN